MIWESGIAVGLGIVAAMLLIAAHWDSRQADRRLAGSIGGLEEQLRLAMAEIAELRGKIAAAQALPSAQSNLAGKDYLQLAGRIRYLNTELAQVHRSLALLFAPTHIEQSKSHLDQALTLAADTPLAPEIHYTLAGVLAQHGDYAEASVELDIAFTRPSNELEKRLTKDIEIGGPLSAFAAAPPYRDQIDRLLLNVSVGI